MIIDEELNIANTSYINKDFATIYEEVINIVKELTNRYDPETSNESDPMIVLFKVMAFLCDKNNYNIDKNILERFLPSATQENSARQLYEMLGYHMHYYKASEVSLTITWTGDDYSFTLPALETTISNTDDDIEFVLTQSATIQGRNIATTVNAIQGTLNTLSVLNSETITLESLDDNNRVYFSETNVAENGVFISFANSDSASQGSGEYITTENGTYWTRVDNLNNQVLGYYIYSFGYDSSEKVPYVEFPSDIANLIGNGLTIKYITTDGASGNVSAKTLTNLVSPTTITGINNSDGTSVDIDLSDEDNITITNSSSSINGEDPETLDDAYNSYKKVVGTFDTLITTRDYQNAMYNTYNSTDNPYVSNVLVCDRRTDYNYATTILTYDSNGTYYKNVELTDSNGNSYITPYDLMVYALCPIQLYTYTAYVYSFQPLTDITNLTSAIEDTSCISHDYKIVDFENRDDSGLLNNGTEWEHIFVIKNYLKLNVNLTTTYKVNTYERNEIIANVREALYEKFNAREVDFGEEIPYDTIYETIKGADERIKNINLAEPTLSTKIMNSQGDEKDFFDSDEYINYLAKNILAGRVALFNYDERFGYSLGQDNITIYESLEYLKSVANITFEENASDNSTTPYTLQENEVIQLVAPNLTTELSYSYGIQYQYTGTTIPANTEYQLQNDDELVFKYTDDDDIVHLIIYTANATYSYTIQNGVLVLGSSDLNATNIFLSDIEIYDTTTGEDGLTPIEYTINGTTYKLYTIGSTIGDSYTTIDKRSINTITLSGAVPCYWLRNNSENQLFLDDEEEIMLEDDEYFFYTDSTYTELASVGSGTTIRKGTATTNNNWKANTLDITEVLEKGYNAINGNWVYVYNGTSGDGLSLTENQILTLTTNDTITLTNVEKELVLNNSLQTLSDFGDNISVSYTISSEDTSSTLANFGITNVSWSIKSRLDINSGTEIPQQLYENQVITLGLSDGTEKELTNGDIFLLNRTLVLTGGDYIDLSEVVLSGDESLFSTEYNVDLYEYDASESLTNQYGTSTITINSDIFVNSTNVVNEEESESEEEESGESETETNSTSTTSTLTYHIPNLSENILVMLYPSISSSSINKTWELTISTSNCQVRAYNQGEDYSTSYKLENGLYILEFNFDNSSGDEHTITFTLKVSTTTSEETTEDEEVNGTLQVGKLCVVSGLNEELGLTSEEESSLLEKISDLDIDNSFYYNASLENDKVISFSDDDYMRSSYTLFDTNNVANKFTICEIDFDNSYIEVVRSSRTNA